jgi:hypothetical protein
VVYERVMYERAIHKRAEGKKTNERRHQRKEKTKSPSTTYLWILELSRITRYPTVSQPSLIRPLIRTLRLPSPLNPPGPFLVRDHLRFPHLPQERLEARAEGRSAAREPGATADARRAGVRTVVARPDAAAVEVLGAVRHGGRPFSDDDPEVERGELGAQVAGRLNVLLLALGDTLCFFFFFFGGTGSGDR